MDQECRHPTLGEERDPQVPHGRDEIALGEEQMCVKLKAVMRRKRTLGSTWTRRTTDGIGVRLLRESRAGHVVAQYCVAAVACVQCLVKDAESLSSNNPKTNRPITRNFYHTKDRGLPHAAQTNNCQKYHFFHFGHLSNLSDIPTYYAPAGTTVTTHLIPAAFPRASHFIPVPASPPDNESKEERGARVRLLSPQVQHGLDNSSTQPRVPWSVMYRYVATCKGNGVA